MKLSKPSLFKRFIFSYIIILSIPVLLAGAFLYRSLVQALSDEVKNSTLTNLSQVMDTLDMKLQELDYITVQISQNKMVTPLLYAKDLNDLTEYQFYTLVSELKNYRATNGFIENISIYLRNTDTVVNADGKYSMPIFFSQVYNYNNLSEADFQHILKNTMEPTVRPVESVKGNNTTKELITFIKPIPVSDTFYNATLLITLDASAINKITQNVLGNFKGKVYIFDEKANVISMIDKNKDLIDKESISTLIKSNNPIMQEIQLNGKRQMVLHLKSFKSGWSYLAVIPSDQIFAKVNTKRIWSIFMILLSVIAGVALAYYFSYGNYKSVKKIVDMISVYPENREEEQSLYEDELDVISSVLKTAIIKNENLEERLNQQMPIIRANFFIRLLNGEFLEQETAIKMAGFTGTELSCGPFAVMVFDINDYDELIEHNSETIKDAYRFAVANVIEELCLQVGKGYTVELSDERIGIIIDFNGWKGDYINELVFISRNAKDFFQSKFKFTLTIGIGKVYNSLMDISKSYMEARTAVDYKMIKGKNTVIVFEQIVTGSNERYYYSSQNEKKIFDYIKEGNFEGISQVLKKIIENVYQKPISIDTARCIYYEIINTAMKVLGELDAEDYNEVLRQGGELPNLLKCDTLDELYSETVNFYGVLCSRMKATEKIKSSDFGESILEFIRNNYLDNNMSLTLVADRFEVTPAYLSRYFKNYTQQNFVEYIHELRLKMVKELLVTTDKSIAEIASVTGYLDSHSLIRGFKKYEGMTPGRFREVQKMHIV